MKSNHSKKNELRRISARYPRVIEWSQEDGCYVGSAPPLIGQCCDGATEAKVAAKLAMIIDDLVQDVFEGKMPEPEGLSKKVYSGKFVVRIPPAVHKKVAQKAMARGESLNQLVADVLSKA